MSLSYLPALKDDKGNRIIGLMGQFHEMHEAVTKQVTDFIWWIPFGLSIDGIVEYDDELGLPNATIEIKGFKGAVISGPLFDKAMETEDGVRTLSEYTAAKEARDRDGEDRRDERPDRD